MRSKRRSPIAEKADTRASGLCSINPQLKLGEELSLSDYKAKIADTRVRLNTYNTLLSDTDAALTALERGEAELADFSERMLKGVVSKFGRDSIEYEKAGGVRKSKIQQPPRKIKNVTDIKKVA